MNNLLMNIIRNKGLSSLYCSVSSSKTPLIINRSLVVLQQNLLLKENSVDNTLSSTTGGKQHKKDGIKITLIGPNHAISVTSLEEAQKLSKRRELKLVKIQDFDTKTQRPVYRLYTTSELLAEETSEINNNEDTSKSSNKKTEKNLTLSNRIADHDLASRIKNISKWLIKGHEVRILIQGTSNDDANNGEAIYKKIENAIKEANNGRIVQKRSKGGNIKLNILPNVTSNKNDTISPS